MNFFHNFSGGKRGHKGGRRHFTDPNALKMAKEKEEKEKEWRRARGEVIGKKHTYIARHKKLPILYPMAKTPIISKDL